MSSDLPDGALGAGEEPDQPGSDGDDDTVAVRRLAVIQLGRHRLAVPVESVRAIIDPPASVTRVPRTPPAITGVTDVRGQITVLVDPHVHFPDSGGPSEDGSLLVFDRPDQPAAIRVDAVHGVETVPEDDVFGADSYDPAEIEGTALAHPLITDAVRIERVDRRSIVDSYATDGEDGIDHSTPIDQVARSAEAAGVPEPTDDGVEVAEFSLDEELHAESTPEPESVDIEVVPLVDVDRLLLASGPVGGRDSVDSEGVGAETSSDGSDSAETSSARSEKSVVGSSQDTEADPVDDGPDELAADSAASDSASSTTGTDESLTTDSQSDTAAQPPAETSGSSDE